MSIQTFSYGPHTLQTVSVANPNPAAPLDNDAGYWVILIHGGAWRDPTQTATSYLHPTLSILSSTSNKKHTPLPITAYASISYRLSAHRSHPQDPSTTADNVLRNAKHPDHLGDIQTALSFLQSKYGFGERYILVGHSCGAMLAFQSVMGRFRRANATSTGLESESKSASGNVGYDCPLAILGMAGIYNLRLLRDSHKNISAYQEFIEGAFGDKEREWDDASPGVVRGVDGVEGGWEGGRIAVLAQSGGDSLVDGEQSEGMRDLLKQTWVGNASRGWDREVYFLPIEGEHDEAWKNGEELAKGIVFTIAKLQAIRFSADEGHEILRIAEDIDLDIRELSD